MQYLDMFGGGKKGRPSDNESEDEQEQEQEQDALLRKNTRANAIGTGAPDATSDMESTTDNDDDDDDDTETSSVANTNTSDEDDDDEDDDADSLNFDDDLQATPAQQAQALTLTPAMIAKSAASALAANPEVKKKVTKRVAKGKATLQDITTLQQSYDDLEVNDDDDDVDDSDGDDAEDADDGTNYLRKFDSEMRENYITAHHHEMMQLNAAEVDALARVVRNVDGVIVDSMHQTMPFLTKYEKTRVLGQRAKQLNQGAQPLVPVDKKIIDGYLIAQLELQQKALPFIIRRPLPGGKSEYWRLADLELI
jgi:DNA-directed RNA polymerase I, II, and III subunit RPABC2